MTTESSTPIETLGKIELCDIPAIIKWDDDQPRGVGSSLSSTPVSLDVDFDPSTTTASFRLRIALLQRGSDKAVPVFLLIGSPQIQSLDTDVLDQTTDDAARDTTCLRFQLSSPPTLVVPPESLRLKDKSQLTTMRSVRWAARQTALSVHVPGHVLSTPQFEALCVVPYSQFTSSVRHTDIGRLYGGRGGKILDAGADDVPRENAPPSYNEVPAPPPMAPLSSGMPLFLRYLPPALHEVDLFLKVRMAAHPRRSVDASDLPVTTVMSLWLRSFAGKLRLNNMRGRELSSRIWKPA